MLILLFLLLVLAGGLIFMRLLAPEMYLRLSSVPRINLPWRRTPLLHDSTTETPYIPSSEFEELPIAIDTPMQAEEMPEAISEKTEKIEQLLLEKNKMIERLTRELQAERSHRAEFENVKNIMDGEIRRLKDQLKATKQ